MTSCVSLVLSNHRPETVAPARALMASHDTVILEEPTDPQFLPMLSGQVGIETYIEAQDIEYPEFGRCMAKTLRELYRAGKQLYQVEPFIDKLLAIHERFADGGGPSDLSAGSDEHRVYIAERDATATLLDFYTVSMHGNFRETVEAVKRFARTDARRFALRDQMRVDALADAIKTPGTYYIEAGQIHYPLWRELKRRLPVDADLTVRFLMADAVREMGLRGHLYGPGDLLTLLYRFHPNRRFREENLFAARALIYNKLIVKAEITTTTEAYPHTRDELAVGATVSRLSLGDCRRLFPLIRRASTVTARDMVRHYQAHTPVPRGPTLFS